MFDENRKAFFDTDEFAVDALWKGTEPIKVQFQNFYSDQRAGNVAVEGSLPSIICDDDDIPDAAHGVTVIISGVTYQVISVQPDGTGFTELVLERQ